VRLRRQLSINIESSERQECVDFWLQDRRSRHEKRNLSKSATLISVVIKPPLTCSGRCSGRFSRIYHCSQFYLGRALMYIRQVFSDFCSAPQSIILFPSLVILRLFPRSARRIGDCSHISTHPFISFRCQIVFVILWKQEKIFLQTVRRRRLDIPAEDRDCERSGLT